MRRSDCMMESTSEIMNKGMNEKFDYTKWQRDYFDAKTPTEIREEAFRFEKEHLQVTQSGFSGKRSLWMCGPSFFLQRLLFEENSIYIRTATEKNFMVF